MAKFEIYGKIEIKKEDVTADQISNLIKKNLSKHYNENKIIISPTGITLKANLESIRERAITEANVTFKKEANQLAYQVSGETSFGRLPWLWFVLGFFAILFDSVFFAGFFFMGFFSDLISYLICKDRPKRYFEEAFNFVQFELG